MTIESIGWILLGGSFVIAVTLPAWLKRRAWGRPWQRAFAIVGIPNAFALWIVPGFLALRAYRRWGDGKRGTPMLLVAWGLFWSAFLVLFLVVVFCSELFLGGFEL